MWKEVRAGTRLALARLIEVLEEAGFAPMLESQPPHDGPDRPALQPDWARPRLLAWQSLQPFDEDVDVFLAGLGERIDACQDAQARGDALGLLRCAGSLAERGEALGLPVLVHAAEEVRRACEDRNPLAAHKAVEELTGIAQRLWRGQCPLV
jgi:hypothetical protein